MWKQVMEICKLGVETDPSMISNCMLEKLFKAGSMGASHQNCLD